MSWLRALKETGRTGLAVQRSRLDPLVAARCAAGLAIMIVFTRWAFGPAVAAGAAFGAFQAAIATLQRSWRPRPELAIASGTSLGVSTFLGYLTGAHHLLFLALLVVWTFLAGLSWAAGPTVGFIASTNVAIMLVTVTLPTSVGQAATHGAMMVVGGLVQAALVVLFPVRRWRAHRDALADALAAEADYARRLREDPVAAFDPQPLMRARDAAALTPRQARARPAELHGARGLAERIRPVLAALADPAVGAAEYGPQRDRARELLAACAGILDAAARAIRRGKAAELSPADVAAFATPDTGAILTGPARRAAHRLGVLLHDVVETAGGTRGTGSGLPGAAWDAEAGADGSGGGADGETGAGTGADVSVPGAASGLAEPEPEPEPGAETRAGVSVPGDSVPGAAGGARFRRRPGFLALLPAGVRAMRAQARRGSQIMRHAVRVSAVAGAGYVIGAVLPLGHGYWAPLAAVMVMRPNFSQTYSRAVARFGGTLVGVALATGIVRLTSPGSALAGGLAVIAAGLMYLVMRSGQLAAQACITAYVVFLLGMGGQQWTQTVPQRVLLTLAGGLLAMVAYAVYPDWETPRLPARLADWLRTNGRYAAAVVERYAPPSARAPGDAEVRAALLEARDARIAWREAKARATTEPVRHRGLSPDAADAAARAVRQLGRAAMLMEAHLPERGTAPWPAAGRLAQALRTSTESGAKAVREGRVPHWTEVRAALEAAAGPGPEPGPRPGPEPGPAPLTHAGSGSVTGSDQVVRHGAELLLDALEELSHALDEGPGRHTDGGGATRHGRAP